MNAALVLQNGLVFRGKSVGAAGTALGQVVFNTGMAGFEETVTDPGYAGQLLAQTYPLAAGSGLNLEDQVSPRVWATGYIVREACAAPSNFRCKLSIGDFLAQQGVVGIEGIDTRALTRVLRDQGALNGAVTTEYDSMSDAEKADLMAKIQAYSGKDAAAAAVPAAEKVLNQGGKPHLAFLDFGCQSGLADALAQRGCQVTVLPGTTGLARLSELQADGLVVADGPGDPAWQADVLPALKAALDSGIPTLGIGLGHELIALAAGAKVEKMLCGHRGANKPVRQAATGRMFTTNQNCGFAVQADTLPAGCQVTYTNAQDGSCAGVQYAAWNCRTVQFQPRVDGGGRGTDCVYDEFIETIKGVH